MEDILVPIFICVVLPVAIVLIVCLTKANAENRRAEVLIKAIETVKRQTAMQKRRLRLSFIAGCVAGNGFVDALAEYPSIVAWSVVGTTSVIIAMNVYEMARRISAEYGAK